VQLIEPDMGGMGLKQMLELNLKLREDLSRSFDSYISLLAKTDQIQRENVQLKLQIARPGDATLQIASQSKLEMLTL
jgi:hypothetical protein